MNNKVVVGGTFDYLHRGHREMLQEAMNIGDCIIGVTSDEMATRNRNREVSSYSKRVSEVREYCRELKEITGSEFVINKIDTPDEDMVYNESVSHIVVSPEDKTIQRVNLINDKRHKMGLNPLKIKVVDAIYADDGKRISSTRISKGIIDEEGNLVNGSLGVDILNDIHYGFFEEEDKNKEILNRLRETLQKRDSEYTFLLGDIIHEESIRKDKERFEKVWEVINENTNKVFFTPGNHDIINLDMDYIQSIVGHDIPKTIEIRNKNFLLIDSASASENDNIGKITEESIEAMEEIPDKTYILTHFPIEYTESYRDSKFFSEYPETVFPINKHKLNINYEKAEREVFAHLHTKDSFEKNGVKFDILPPFLDITSVEPRDANISNNIKNY